MTLQLQSSTLACMVFVFCFFFGNLLFQHKLLGYSQILFLALDVFAFSNIIPSSSTSSSPGGDDSLFRVWFSVCHLVGMLSALANPVLYGYYNQVCVLKVKIVRIKPVYSEWLLRLPWHGILFQGFQKEFSKILCCLSGRRNRRFSDVNPTIIMNTKV